MLFKNKVHRGSALICLLANSTVSLLAILSKCHTSRCQGWFNLCGFPLASLLLLGTVTLAERMPALERSSRPEHVPLSDVPTERVILGGHL